MKTYSLVYVPILSIRPDSSDLDSDALNMSVIVSCENLSNNVKITFVDFHDLNITYVFQCTISALLKIIINFLVK